MSLPDLHIISFAVPYPPVYGGAIDSWFRLRMLKDLGLKIALHCFVYHQFKPQRILQEVAQEVHYYPRVLWPALLTRSLPYIVASRRSKSLYSALAMDQQPVLCEGIHTTGFVTEFPNRKWLLRAHNIEHQYYGELADKGSGVKSLVYLRESKCLEHYEKQTAPAFDRVFAISPHDYDWFKERNTGSVLIPPFHGFDIPDCPTGRGQYVLYQGDLSLPVNQDAVLDLLQRLPEEVRFPLVIAGRSGQRSFEEKLTAVPNLRREADVSEEKMSNLIRQAQLILIHSLHGSGMKLKLFPALFHGRFVAATEKVRTGTILDGAIQYYQPDQVMQMIERLWPIDFTPEMASNRSALLEQYPGDRALAGEIIRYL